ncbi:MAG TPA: tRNA (guanosine(37)-N1)-methyltransferase TrmD [Gammaproteobacteria bacterium]|nr:tRNA (guanosine(37)-N1)-methyltransferase TrmD [Gammaproteobacteria bacterium]
MLRVDVVTLFPELVRAVTGFGIVRRAVERELLAVHTWNPRDFARDRHRTVDDRPYGGGPGMVMKPEPLCEAIRAARDAGPEAPAVYLSPQGERFGQEMARRWSGRDRLILLAGRYEGVDERVIASEVDAEVSLGDYVLSGGEPAAIVVIDAVTRLLPGALGDEASAAQDSFWDGLLDYPHYTRPEELDGMAVPGVLLSGDHAAVRRWRLKQALGRTWLRRPDLLEGRALDGEQQALLDEFVREHEG